MKKYRKLVFLFLLNVIVITMIACAKDKMVKELDDAETKELRGTITMAGSTSMEKLSRVLAEGFTSQYEKVSIAPEFTGSSAGIEALRNGTADIGNSSRALKEEEKAAGVVENIVAIDGMALIVHKDNTVDNLTKEELAKVFVGAITNWKELGGSDQPIIIIGRESGSGTRTAFEELLKIENQAKYSNEINSTGGVLAKVASTPGAIGYVSLDVINDNSVLVLKLDQVEAKEENIKSGSYFLCRPFIMATKGPIEEQKELVQEFFHYLKTEEGKRLIQSVGLVVPD